MSFTDTKNKWILAIQIQQYTLKRIIYHIQLKNKDVQHWKSNPKSTLTKKIEEKKPHTINKHGKHTWQKSNTHSWQKA